MQSIIAVLATLMFLTFSTVHGQGIDLLPVLDSQPVPPGGVSIDRRLAPAGDINADGIPDWLFSDSSASFGNLNQTGFVAIISGADGAVLFSQSGLDFSAFFGGSIGTQGDVDGDGFDDFIVSAPRITSDSRIYVFSGATGTPIRLHSSLAVGNFITMPAIIGDIDADGCDDYAFLSVVTGTSVAIVNVHSGATGSPIYQVPGASFANILRRTGDVDGDGVGDFLHAGSLPTLPRIYVRSGASGAILYIINDDAPRNRNIDTGRDVTGDGIPDILVGSPTTSGNGVVRLYSGATGALVYSYTGSPSAQLGQAVALLGDVNGDGHSDFGSAASGLLRIWSGVNGALLTDVTGNAQFAQNIAGLGDSNGDGFAEILIDGARIASADRIDRVTIGGAVPYGLSGPAAQRLDHGWMSTSAMTPSIGAFHVTGGDPGSVGLYAVSLNEGTGTILDVDLYIDLAPTAATLIPITFDAVGELHVPFDLSNPVLAPLSFRSQVFESNSSATQGVFSSNALEFIFAP